MPYESPVRRLLPGPDRDQVAADLKAQYEAGASIRSLAQSSGRSYGAVHRLLAEAGAGFRSRGGVRLEPPTP
ncbi:MULTISPECIES: helix-turn-helix domain-containing protein [unclassified Streptomyces]|uniref:helix-turn-helix domain-containing protein n=1 Tax=unclassified Streptomyces TaxID=2593676 RepID=UPI00226EF0FE|nr:MULTISPECIES: helix-turn-helix domain-containing protein [unclassified Streptomyces]MCY0923548.1 helix-turn-helix domain-containing protein [Streptomyces sp. H27-G5]MCY0962682.1 helix-turn-helix domain-containing protein [Streptomyces sp. H27-H5]